MLLVDSGKINAPCWSRIVPSWLAWSTPHSPKGVRWRNIHCVANNQFLDISEILLLDSGKINAVLEYSCKLVGVDHAVFPCGGGAMSPTTNC